MLLLLLFLMLGFASVGNILSDDFSKAMFDPIALKSKDIIQLISTTDKTNSVALAVEQITGWSCLSTQIVSVDRYGIDVRTDHTLNDCLLLSNVRR